MGWLFNPTADNPTPLDAGTLAWNAANDVFADFRRAIHDARLHRPPNFTVTIMGMVTGDLPEYNRLTAEARALGYDIQRHAPEPLGLAAMALMFIRLPTK